MSFASILDRSILFFQRISTFNRLVLPKTHYTKMWLRVAEFTDYHYESRSRNRLIATMTSRHDIYRIDCQAYHGRLIDDKSILNYCDEKILSLLLPKTQEMVSFEKKCSDLAECWTAN